jgi:hypothetical protein
MIFVSAGFERRGSIAIADVMRTAHFRHIDPAAERICLYTSKSASESESHLMLKMVQLERFQRAIDANFKHDDLLVIPEKTIRAEGLYRRPDLSLSRKVSIFSGRDTAIFHKPCKIARQSDRPRQLNCEGEDCKRANNDEKLVFPRCG